MEYNNHSDLVLRSNTKSTTDAIVNHVNRGTLIMGSGILCECGHKILSNHNFCTNCGTKLRNVCETCSNVDTLESKFCYNCGDKF